MARPKYSADPLHIKSLRKSVSQSFGRQLTHSLQCEALSKDIKKVTGTYVSAQTLRRFFGFLKTEFSPAIKTLEALSNYSGFPNWHSFTEQFSSASFQPLSLDQEAALYLNFYQIDVRKEAD